MKFSQYLILALSILQHSMPSCAMDAANIGEAGRFVASLVHPREMNPHRIIEFVGDRRGAVSYRYGLSSEKTIHLGHYQNGATFAAGTTMGDEYEFFNTPAHIQLDPRSLPAFITKQLPDVRMENIEFVTNIFTNNNIAATGHAPIGPQADTFNVVFHDLLINLRHQRARHEYYNVHVQAGIFGANGATAIRDGIAFNRLSPVHVVSHPVGADGWAYSPNNARLRLQPDRHVITFWIVCVYDPARDSDPTRRLLPKKAYVTYAVVLYDASEVRTKPGPGPLTRRTRVTARPFVTPLRNQISVQPSYQRLLRFLQDREGMFAPQDRAALHAALGTLENFARPYVWHDRIPVKHAPPAKKHPVAPKKVGAPRPPHVAPVTKPLPPHIKKALPKKRGAPAAKPPHHPKKAMPKKLAAKKNYAAIHAKIIHTQKRINHISARIKKIRAYTHRKLTPKQRRELAKLTSSLIQAKRTLHTLQKQAAHGRKKPHKKPHRPT